jgi:hypothetical protein
MVKTKLKKDDVISYNAGRVSQSIKLFRPSKKRVTSLYFKGKSGTPFELFCWQLDRGGFEALAELMAVSAGCYVVPINCSHLPDVTWAYQVC